MGNPTILKSLVKTLTLCRLSSQKGLGQTKEEYNKIKKNSIFLPETYPGTSAPLPPRLVSLANRVRSAVNLTPTVMVCIPPIHKCDSQPFSVVNRDGRLLKNIFAIGQWAPWFLCYALPPLRKYNSERVKFQRLAGNQRIRMDYSGAHRI